MIAVCFLINLLFKWDNSFLFTKEMMFFQVTVAPMQSLTPMSSGIQSRTNPSTQFTPSSSPGQQFGSPQPMLFNPSSMASSQSLIKPPMPSTPFMQSASSTAHPPTGHSGLPPRRIYPQMTPQGSYNQPQYPSPSVPTFQPTMASSIYQPTSQFPTQPLDTQAAQSTYQSSPMVPSIPQHQMQPFMPQNTQQFPSYTEGEAPVLPVVQHGQSHEGVVPSTLVAPVQPHWFYLKDDRIWMPFSFIDSDSLEHAHR